MTRDSRKLNVLIVEDNKNEFELVSICLKKSNINLVNAPSLVKAKELLEEGIFDVCLLDLHLSDSGEDQTCEAIPFFTSRVAVIILTAERSERIVRKAVEYGAKKFFLKDAEWYLSGELEEQLFLAARENSEWEMLRNAKIDARKNSQEVSRRKKDAVQNTDAMLSSLLNSQIAYEKLASGIYTQLEAKNTEIVVMKLKVEETELKLQKMYKAVFGDDQDLEGYASRLKALETHQTALTKKQAEDEKRNKKLKLAAATASIGILGYLAKLILEFFLTHLK